MCKRLREGTNTAAVAASKLASLKKTATLLLVEYIWKAKWKI